MTDSAVDLCGFGDFFECLGELVVRDAGFVLTLVNLDVFENGFVELGSAVVFELAVEAVDAAGELYGVAESFGADFAVGCTYKYLNGGPGSPSFLWVPARHQDAARPALTGWQGHAKPFDFTVDYEPAPGITRFRVGTPQLLSLAGLEASLDVWADVDMEVVRTKSLALTDLFIALVETRLAAYDLEIVTPRDHDRRGSQVSLRIDGGYQIMQALIARGVIGDFRAPDLMRFGFTPLYLGYTDVWDAVSVLEEILTSGIWQDERFARRGAVT